MIIGALLLIGGEMPLLAQNFQGANLFQNIASEAQSVGKYIINIAYVLIGIVGIICLIPAAAKAFKGEAQSKDAITTVGIGLIIAFIILSIIKAVMAFS